MKLLIMQSSAATGLKSIRSINFSRNIPKSFRYLYPRTAFLPQLLPHTTLQETVKMENEVNRCLTQCGQHVEA